jgi:hypothetical protein
VNLWLFVLPQIKRIKMIYSRAFNLICKNPLICGKNSKNKFVAIRVIRGKPFLNLKNLKIKP